MSYEIIYTSVRKNLRGKDGYGTVAASDGIPGNIWAQLEKLTGYEHLYKVTDRNFACNPVAYVHYVCYLNSQYLHIYGRVSNTRVDYSGRSNLIAHLVAAGERELAQIDNPAEVLRSIDWIDNWPEERPATMISEKNQTRILQRAKSCPSKCETWEQFTGHAGWGGVLAESILNPKIRSAAIIVPQEFLLKKTDAKVFVQLVSESLNLLPPRKRRDVKFSTYFTDNLQDSIKCDWGFVIDETPLATKVRRDPRVLTIDLGADLGIPTGGECVQVASHGGTLSWEEAKKSRGVVSRDIEDDVHDAEGVLAPVDEETPGNFLPALPGQSRRGRSSRKKKSWLKSLQNEIQKNIKAVGIGTAVAVLLFLVLMFFNRSKQETPQHVVKNPEVLPENPFANQRAINPSSKPKPLDEKSQSQTAAQLERRSSLPPEGKMYADEHSAESNSGGERKPQKTSIGEFALNRVDQQPVMNRSDHQDVRNDNSSQPKSSGPKPFDALRQQKSRLPLQKPNRGLSGGSSPRIKLGRIDIPDGSELALQVLGTEEILGNGIEFKQNRKVSDDGQEVRFEIRRKGATSFGAGDEVGQFLFKESELQFEWAKQVNDSGYKLMNCLLQLTISGAAEDKIVCALQVPQTSNVISLAGFTEAKKAIDLLDLGSGVGTDVDLRMEVKWAAPNALSGGVSVEVNGDRVVKLNTNELSKLSYLRINDTNVEFWANEGNSSICVVTTSLEQSSGKVKSVFSKIAIDQDVQSNMGLFFDGASNSLHPNKVVSYADKEADLSEVFLKERFPAEVNSKRQTIELKISSNDRDIKFRSDSNKKINDMFDKATDEEKDKMKNQRQINNRFISSRNELKGYLATALERNGKRIERMQQINETVKSVTDQTEVHLRVIRKLKAFPEEDVLVLFETNGFPEN